jgi:hypothetical protein
LTPRHSHRAHHRSGVVARCSVAAGPRAVIPRRQRVNGPACCGATHTTGREATATRRDAASQRPSLPHPRYRARRLTTPTATRSRATCAQHQRRHTIRFRGGEAPRQCRGATHSRRQQRRMGRGNNARGRARAAGTVCGGAAVTVTHGDENGAESCVDAKPEEPAEGNGSRDRSAMRGEDTVFLTVVREPSHEPRRATPI